MSVQIQVRSEHRDASPAFGSAHADSGIAARLGTSEVRTTLLVFRITLENEETEGGEHSFP